MAKVIRDLKLGTIVFQADKVGLGNMSCIQVGWKIWSKTLNAKEVGKFKV